MIDERTIETMAEALGYEAVRREIFREDTTLPKMHLDKNGLRFNDPVYDYFDGAEYVFFLCKPEDARLIILEAGDWKRKKDCPRPVRWSREIGNNAAQFAAHLMEMTGLNKGLNYRLYGTANSIDERRAMVFDLGRCVATVPATRSARTLTQEEENHG